MKKKVLIVEDSKMMQKVVARALSLDSDLTVVGVVPDVYAAREVILKEKPDLMTLDLNLPGVDGLSFLESVMSHLPMKVVVISSFTAKGSPAAVRALELGAVDVIEKPTADMIKSDDKLRLFFTNRISMAAKASLQLPKRPVISSAETYDFKQNQLIAVASSTGGTEALKVFLAGFGRNSPPILVAQHMPAQFTNVFAQNLQKILPLKIFEATNGQMIECNSVYIAPGDWHMTIKSVGSRLQIKLNQDPPLHNVRPAADFLLKSAAEEVGPSATGVVLTGMGKDGAAGLLEMKKAGCYTLAQSERTCVVFGMPHAAKQLCATEKLLDLDKIAADVIRNIKGKSGRE